MSRYVKVSTIGSQLLNFFTPNDRLSSVEKAIKDHWARQFDQVLPDFPDLIVVNEACDTPINLTFERQKEFHASCGEEMLNFFKDTAKNNNCCIAYSGFRYDEQGNFRNSTRLIDKTGVVAGIYDKKYPTISEIDDYGTKPGDCISVIECDFGKVGMLICFDLNYENIRLEYAKKKPDLLLFSSMYHGGLMQNYWAYSCRSHFVGAVSGLQCTIVSPAGEVIAKSTNYFNYATASINLDCGLAHLDYNWEPLKNAKSKYKDDFKMTDPGYLGAVLISSESEKLTVEDIAKDTGIEMLDDYFNRYLSYRRDKL